MAEAAMKKKKIPGNYVGMPAAMHLEEFGSQIWSAFGSPPYLVGSATKTKDWRDVDVRLMLSDSKYKQMGFGDPARAPMNGKWVALCMAFSALGKQMTGLPIDFQIQQESQANNLYSRKNQHHRVPLAFIELRFRKKR